MKKYISVLFLLTFIIPSIAFASWWNPFTWKVFHKKEITPNVQVEIQKTPEEKISELQKQLDGLNNQKITSSTTTQTPEKPVQKKLTNTKIEVSSESSWKAIEDYLLPIADGQGLTDFRTTNHEANDPRYYTKENNKWTWKSEGKTRITLHGGPNSFLGSDVNTISCNGRVTNFRTSVFCPTGQKFDCPETGYNSCVSTVTKNNNTTQSQTSNTVKTATPILPPTADQLAGVMRLCTNIIQNGTSSSLIKSCDPNTGTIWEGYYSNIIFRNQIDIFVTQIDALNTTKSLNSIKQKSNCYYPSSETLSKLTPWAGTFLIQNACGTATEGDKVNYQMEELKHQLSGLQDTVSKNKAQALQREDLERLQKQNKDLINSSSQNNNWTVIFENNGGRVFNSAGQGYNFNCTGNTCITY